MQQPIFNLTSYFKNIGYGSDVDTVSSLLADSYIALYRGVFALFDERELIEKNTWEFKKPIIIDGCVFTLMFWNNTIKALNSEVWCWHKFPDGPIVLNNGGTIDVNFVIKNRVVDCRGMILQKREFE